MTKVILLDHQSDLYERIREKSINFDLSTITSLIGFNPIAVKVIIDNIPFQFITEKIKDPDADILNAILIYNDEIVSYFRGPLIIASFNNNGFGLTEKELNVLYDNATPSSLSHETDKDEFKVISWVVDQPISSIDYTIEGAEQS